METCRFALSMLVKFPNWSLSVVVLLQVSQALDSDLQAQFSKGGHSISWLLRLDGSLLALVRSMIVAITSIFTILIGLRLR